MSLDHYFETVLELWSEKRARTQSVISGDSMAPSIRDGDTVVIEHGDGRPRIGDVVVVRREGAIVVHRLIHRDVQGGHERFLTRGDRCRGIDPPVRRDQIVGKVVEVRSEERLLRLDSRWWRGSSFLLARLFYLSGRRHVDEGDLGWAARLLFAIRRRALPARISAMELLTGALSKTQRSVSASKNDADAQGVVKIDG